MEIPELERAEGIQRGIQQEKNPEHQAKRTAQSVRKDKESAS